MLTALCDRKAKDAAAQSAALTRLMRSMWPLEESDCVREAV